MSAGVWRKMSDSRTGWTDGEGAAAGESGAALNAAKSAFPSWDVQRVERSPLDHGQHPQGLPGQTVNRPEQGPPPRRRGWFLGAFLGVLVLAAVAAFGYWLGVRDSAGDDDVAAELSSDDVGLGDPAAPADDEVDSETAAGGSSEDLAGGEQAGGQGADYVAPDVNPGAAFGFVSDGVDASGRPLPVLPEVLIPNTENAAALPFYAEEPVGAPAEGPYTVIKGGYFFLRGSLPSENIRQELISRNLLILPPEQVVIEFAVDPNNTWYFGEPIPVFLLDKLLFDVGSTEINPDFLPLFQIGANLTMIDERVTISVIGHADSQGDEQSNLELSQARVDAVKAAYVQLGANPDQIIAIGKGESEPLADNSTAEGRALNRRVEFIIESSEAEGVEAG